MTDYNKLTVVKLKAELKQRNLPSTGLKPVLVARLAEADAQTKQEALGLDLAGTGDDEHNHIDTVVTAPDDGQSGRKNAEAQNNATETAHKLKTVDESATKDDSQSSELDLNEGLESQNKAVTSDHKQPSPEGLREQVSTDVAPAETLAEDEKSTVLPSISDEALPSTDSITFPANQPVSNLSTQTSPNKEEIVEDRKKRKRRSQSPPPSSVETAQKRVKAENGSPRVKLVEDLIPDRGLESGPVEQSNAATANASIDDPVIDPELHEQRSPENEKGDIYQQESAVNAIDTEIHDSERSLVQNNETPGNEHVEIPSRLNPPESPSKTSPSDTRFRNLFSAPPKRGASPPKSSDLPDVDDRIVKSAIHPATSALYIRNFMRPLHQGALKDHLLALATSPDASPSPDLLTDFFLDSIRTHCLVGFTTPQAASRVRSALHDRVWPDERTRKPLWVDFIPEEKLKKWIEVEQDASSSRGQPTKRWEVVYEEEASGTTAYLQEADGSSGASRHTVSAATKNEAGKGVQGAPLGPRISDERGPPAQAAAARQSDSGKGFKALDDLFKSTAAKPKLYYLPAPKAVAERRLDKLAAGRGGGRGGEMRRYTFEEDIIVDKGPEFGSSSRGGYRGRGSGFGGVYSSRGGGGYRGNDNWRDNRR
ncbi:hypothetical protein MMC06_005824 [Schaereria dolodes]|nr:hypothetical protein [Schaereria dolodes]